MTNYHQTLLKIQDIAKACGRDPFEVRCVVISKGRSVETMQEVFHEGARDFGENRLQEATEKMTQFAYANQCTWHFIGKLQTKKIAKTLPFFSLIHSVDSIDCVEKIDHFSRLQNRVTSLLLQVNILGDPNKLGLCPDLWEEGLKKIATFSHINVEGLMTMAPFTDSKEEIRRCFRSLNRLKEKWTPLMPPIFRFHHLSMGMSRDFSIAIEEGATLLRLGTLIFTGIASFHYLGGFLD